MAPVSVGCESLVCDNDDDDVEKVWVIVAVVSAYVCTCDELGGGLVLVRYLW